jgi:hypothetical protein
MELEISSCFIALESVHMVDVGGVECSDLACLFVCWNAGYDDGPGHSREYMLFSLICIGLSETTLDIAMAMLGRLSLGIYPV